MRILILIIFLFLFVLGCGKKETIQQKQNEEIVKQEEQTFGGAGEKKEFIYLKKGIASIEYGSSVPSPLTMTVKDSTGNIVGIFYNKPNPIQGMHKMNVPFDGKYILEINSNSKWTVKIW